LRAEQGGFQTPKYFDSITVRIASPEQIKEWAKKTACHCAPGKSKDCDCGEVKKNRKLSITVLSDLNRTVCSAKPYLDRRKTGNALAVNIKE